MDDYNNEEYGEKTENEELTNSASQPTPEAAGSEKPVETAQNTGGTAPGPDFAPEKPAENPYEHQAEEYRRQTAQQQQPQAPRNGSAAGGYTPQNGQNTGYGQAYPRQNYGTQQGYGGSAQNTNPYDGRQNGNPYTGQQNGNANPYSNQGQYNPYRQRYDGQAQRPAAPYQQQYRQPYGNPAPAPEQNAPAPQKKNTGKKVFAVLIALILVIALAVAGVSIKRGLGAKNNTDDSNSGITSQQNPDSSSKSESDEGSGVKIAVASASADKNALTTDAIAEKARESCAGVLVYTNADSSSAAGQGSGILVPIESSADDSKKYTYVLTCAHVIDDSNVSVKVQLEDGTAYDAEVVGYDVKTDVGVLRIQASGLPVCEIGDSSALKVGSSVYAVGNPGGIEFFGSFTDGIVSAIDRPISSEIGYTMSCIQHTAAINPGNSGGALVNAYGQVIGINSQKIASASYEGMGFAIPINQAVKIADDLISYGYVKDRAKIGITYYPLSTSTQYSMIARYNNLPSGALIIKSISPDSSLAGTQVKQYDMIIAVNGEDLDKADVLLEKIDNGKAGDTLTLTIGRINNDYTVQTFDVKVTLIEDKGSAGEAETTTQPNLYPFGSDGFGFNFGN